MLWMETLMIMNNCFSILGYHLGIEDEFNVCRSVEFMEACHDDFAAWTPRRLETSRESATQLRDVCFTALGNISGIGRNFWTTQYEITMELVHVQQVSFLFVCVYTWLIDCGLNRCQGQMDRSSWNE
jgi:hypothetical protein